MLQEYDPIAIRSNAPRMLRVAVGSVATPGSLSRRAEARKVQYRLYAEMDGVTYTDGVLHQHELSEDITH